ncbi:MAG: hypothetical protein WDN49_27915 [Acetobacteraceae bacterium]
MFALLPLLLLAGCDAAAGAFAGAEAVSVPVLGRGVVDVGASAITGKDCSVVRLDRGQTYCAPREHPPGAPPFCTQTLGTVQCWSNPEAFGALPPRDRGFAGLDARAAAQSRLALAESLNLSD